MNLHGSLHPTSNKVSAIARPTPNYPRRLLPIILMLVSASLLSAASNWPQFRGPDAMGVADNPGLPETWSSTNNIEWKTPVPGRGWSSPIVWGNKIFLTTTTSEGEMEPPKKGLYFGGERKEVPKAAHQWWTLCLDLETGRELWRRQAKSAQPANPLHVKNTYASETPVTDGRHVYSYFGNVGVFCYDMDGREIWNRSWPAVKTRYGWGSAASPVLNGDRLFIVNDNDDASFIVALNAATGEVMWKQDRDEKSNWSTPYVWKNEKRTELITTGTRKTRSYDLNGQILWELSGMSSIVIPTPFSKFGLLYVASGYVGDKVRPFYAIRPGASGDISLREGETENSHVAWSARTAAPYNPSPLVYGDQLYVLFDFGFLGCHDARTGKVHYEKERIRPEAATAFTASPWAANGKIFALSEDGDTFVFEAGPKYKLVRVNPLNEMCMSTPALVGDRLLIRTLSSLYSVRNRQPVR